MVSSLIGQAAATLSMLAMHAAATRLRGGPCCQVSCVQLILWQAHDYLGCRHSLLATCITVSDAGCTMHWPTPPLAGAHPSLKP